MIVPDGFHIIGTKLERLARWREQREQRSFDRLLEELRRKMQGRGLCRFCTREVGLLPGTVGSVTRFHFDGEGRRCVGAGRAPA